MPWPMADLCNKAHTNYVSSVERGERNLSLHNIVRLAYALDMEVSVLLRPLDKRQQP